MYSLRNTSSLFLGVSVSVIQVTHLQVRGEAEHVYGSKEEQPNKEALDTMLYTDASLKVGTVRANCGALCAVYGS